MTSNPLLDSLFAPFQRYLNDAAITEISLNKAGELWIERLGQSTIEQVRDIAFTNSYLRRLGHAIAANSDQHISEENPLLSARLPTGERIQIVFPPASPSGVALSIRKQVLNELTLDQYETQGAFEQVVLNEGKTDSGLKDLLAKGDILAFLKEAVYQKKNIIISGGTSTGKTTFTKALLREIPATERLVTIEDTQELFPTQPNSLSLVSSKGGQGTAKVTVQDLLEASLRLRPDRILLGELRGAEAYSFLRAINTGHPGSITTIHANTPIKALEQLSLMVMQANLGLEKAEIMELINSIVDIVIQLERINGKRIVSGIKYQ